MRPVLAALAAALVPSVLACTPASPPAVQTMTSAATPTTVSEVDQEVVATVEGVDMGSRILTLRRTDGSLEKVYAPATIRNLPQVRLGDQVVVTYVASMTAVPTATPGNPTPLVDEAVMTAPEGGKPGIATGSALTAVVTVDSYDPASHVVTFTGPSGVQRMAQIQSPQMQALASNLKKGDRVQVILSEAASLEIRAPEA
jgi:hypothetical protein